MHESQALPPLRAFQLQALEILRSSSSSHLICTASTGAGKSRIFEEAVREGSDYQICRSMLVISPLQALVRQHADQLSSQGVRLVEQFDEWSEQPRAFVCTPEKLARKLDRGWAIPPDCLLVVDECHCIEDWGASFRPQFRVILNLVSRFEIRRSVWLSATITPSARSELLRHLPRPVHEFGEFSLNPLLKATRVRVPWASRPDFIREWLSREASPGIIFCATRSQCLEISRLLRAWTNDASSAAHYHAGMSAEERLSVEKKIRDGTIRWVSATTAFGMGMNFPSLKWVVLWQVPFSALDLAQMLGRAGRVWGDSARAFLLWDDSDFLWLRSLTSLQKLQTLESLYRSPSSIECALKSIFDLKS